MDLTRARPHSRHALGVVVLGMLLTPAGLAQSILYAHVDALGNVRALTDEAGNVVERHDYLPHGEECLTGACAANPAGSGQSLRFTGKERDKETGLDYFGARYYESRVGRFTSVDPARPEAALTDPQQWNRYAYARNNPLRFVDPDGRQIRIAADNNAGIAINAAIREAVIHFLGMDRPASHPHARLGAAVVSLTLSTFLPATEEEAAAALVGSAFGMATPLKGGVGPIQKGLAGVQRSVAAAEARGEVVLGTEITIDTTAARTRIDLATQASDGTLRLIECKNGPCAALTPNQRAAFPRLQSEGGVPRGANAAKAGLTPGTPIGPTDVLVERHQ